MKIFEKIKRYATLTTGNFEKLFGNREIPVLPEAVLKLVDALKKHDVHQKEIAEIISSDPGLSIQVLKVANSAFFSFRSEIKTIYQAVNVLGFRNIESIAITYGVQKAVKDPDVGDFDFNLFWSTSLYRALISKELSSRYNLGSPDEAFTGSLLQDIALPVLLKDWFNEYKIVYEEWLRSEKPLSEIENKKLSWNHAQAGAWMAKKWHLPSILVCCIGLHIEKIERIIKLELDKTSVVPVALSSKIPFKNVTEALQLKEEANIVGLQLQDILDTADKAYKTLEEIASIFNIKQIKVTPPSQQLNELKIALH
ncbi:metal-dependent hydrolase HDOD [Thermosulfidibacter takaii ABI70S6]|uniref:Metal-dependent hydrolase HDOD n=1 Tax=Thermosulfidibacter takaii (strain DSM 17441 / JCM 13301 / NBRC 103674 / ABI70S6) TaxID=1298851 RepID=A0A0S3QV99_THET7|nr:HDOD domain-containing protein [Thermosulfidibacter takaii]BAT72239.1 metal-dependent hydrolase HDOD [Thermosulfidibacter takaii ABI70S6]